jgi:hypothetical protein
MFQERPANLVEKPVINEGECFDFQEWGLKGKWLVIEKGRQKLEGAMYNSDNPNGELIIFVPGFPGLSVKWFEENDVATLLQAGYDVFVARHTGIKANAEFSDLTHNSRRLSQGNNLGTDLMEIKNWLSEPKFLMEYFADRPITMITHSFGSLAMANSLIDLQNNNKAPDNPIRNLKKWVNLSGGTYSLETFQEERRGGWESLFDTLIPRCCNPIPAAENVRQLEDGFRKMETELPKLKLEHSFGVVSVNPTEDEYTTVESGLNVQEKLDFGITIEDRTIAKKDLPPGVNIHNYPHLVPDVLLRLVQMKTSSSKHHFVIGDLHKEDNK